MKHLKISLVLVLTIFIVITAIFFYPVFLKGYIPFPGDLLLAEYQPWRSSSYNGIAAGGVPNKAQYFDSLRQMYPWKTFAIDKLKTGELPLWNPHNFSGSPLFANFQSAILFPLNIFYFLFEQVTAWAILVMLQPFLSLISVYLLARHFGLSKIAAVFSATSYAFSLYMATFLEYNIMGHFMYLIPFAMLSVEWIIDKKRWAPLALTSVVAISGFAGHAQLFAGLVGYTLLYVFIRTMQLQEKWTDRLLLCIFTAFFVLVGIGMTGIQLLPGLELVGESARSAHTPESFYNNLLIRPLQLVLYFVPDLFGNPAVKNYLLPFSYPSKALYIGLPALFLALISFFNPSKNDYWKAITIITAVVASIVVLTPISMVVYRLNLPFLSTSSPSNFIFMVSLGLCLLAGFGLDCLFKQRSEKPYIVLALFWTILGATLIITKATHTNIVIKNLIYSFIVLFAITIAVGFAKISKKRMMMGILLVVISCLDLFYFFHKFNPFVPATYIYPQTPINNWLIKNAGINRFWGYGSAGIEANFATQIGTYSPEGYDPLYPKYYGEIIQTSVDGNIPQRFNDKTRSDAIIAPGYGKANMVNNPYRLKILSIMGVRYILDKSENGSTIETFPSDIFTNVASINDFRVFEYKNSTPRFFMTVSYRLYKTNYDFKNILFDHAFNPGETILLSEKPKIDLSIKPQNKQAALVSYKPDSIVINTISDANTLLYLSDTYYPGWQAFIDNNPSKIYRANYAFRAVGVPAGSHRVEFKYLPVSLKNGLYLTIFSVILTLVCFIIFALLRIPKIGYNKKK